MTTPGSTYSFTVRIKTVAKTGMVGAVTEKIGSLGGDIGAIDIVSASKDYVVRDYMVNVSGVEGSKRIVEALEVLDGVQVQNVSDRTFLMHLGGKIEVTSKSPLNTRDELSRAYTPGVARVCTEIADDISKVYNLTIKRNTVAIVTDGTAVLGLGDIGPEAALPVMEGKAMLFKRFGGINAFPICLDTKDIEEIVETVIRIAPVFGGINLEDISAPRCFEVEKRLIEALDIPVFHDDQHGTAVVVMAGIINALRVVGKEIDKVKIVVNGLGAAGMSIIRLLACEGATNIIGVDSKGILYRGRKEGMNKDKESILKVTNPDSERGGLGDAVRGAHIFIGVSAPNILSVDMVKSMADDPIVFALANPDPEIDPHMAAPYVRVMATGRSDFPNQVNNVLCFPGLFKGLLDSSANFITHEMKMAAAEAIADVVGEDELSEDYIIPSVFDERVGDHVAKAVAQAAYEGGVARRRPKPAKREGEDA